MKQDKIDILLATYNGFSFIASQLDSILSQNYKNIRLIIRDDCSTDSTRKILETYVIRFPEIITLLPFERRFGVKSNFSILMEHSDADYIMFADQDDVWEESKVHKTYEKMKELERNVALDTPLLVHSDLKVADRDLNLLSRSFWQYSEIDPLKGQTLNRLLMQNVVTGCAMMINRSLLQLALPIPEHSAMHDWWIAIVAAAFGKIDIVPEPTLWYRQHGKNILGAKKFLSFGYFKQGLEKMREPGTAKLVHANELLSRYSERLDQTQREMLHAYQELPNATFTKKLFLIFKYKFFKIGLLRNIVNVLFKKL